uniref:Sodium-coupled monocarboxylate transporter 1 n=1 Tax=Photinus pyralis TaxID=7054 RepID=A0A1Y1M5J0_PHOPY
MNSSLIEIRTSIPPITFSWLDYVVFAALLGMSGSIGIFFGCFGSKQNSSGEYLLGGKRLHIVPVAMSIIASNISGLAVLGAPADIYRYGAYFIWSIIPILTSSLACVYVFMPVLLQLELITTYQYLQLRFGKSVKILASFMYIFQLVTYNPVVIFLPCLAFSQATGYNIYLIAPATTVFCVFYTAIGGLKTVVWTDTLQSISILLGSVVVLAMGLYQSGGVGNVFKIARDGGRLDVFNFDLDPTVRDTFWTFAVGSSAMWMVDVAVNQGTLQRLSAVPTFAKVKLVMVLFGIISVIFKVLTTITGIAVYARYADCDPLQSGKALHMDQLVPYYVMDVGGSILGLPGLFIAGVFAAALSTLSTNLLNLATTIYTDFLSGFVPKSTPEKKISYLLKLIVVVVGIVDCCLVFLVAKFGGILQFAISLLGITYGSLLGIFTLGMVFPIANEKGALSGGLAGLIFSGFMVFGNLFYKYHGLLPDHRKPISTQGCNVTTPLLR